jgi:hypothetical protein
MAWHGLTQHKTLAGQAVKMPAIFPIPARPLF